MKGSLCSDINSVYSPVNISKSLITSCPPDWHSCCSSPKELFWAFLSSPRCGLCCHSLKTSVKKGTNSSIPWFKWTAAGFGVSSELSCITVTCRWHLLSFCPGRYIHQPLLLEGKKFDVRSFLLIACTAPYVLFFAQGYVRLTCVNYDVASDDLTVHLTNQVK